METNGPTKEYLIAAVEWKLTLRRDIKGIVLPAAPYCTKCTVLGAVSLTRPLADKYLFPKRVFDPT